MKWIAAAAIAVWAVSHNAPLPIQAGLVAAAVGLGYIGACCWWPFANCLRCKGEGKFHSPFGGSWRRCRRCSGSGERVRVGRRLWTWWTETWSKGRA